MRQIVKPKERPLYFGVVNGRLRLAAMTLLMAFIFGSAFVFNTYAARYEEDAMYITMAYVAITLGLMSVFFKGYKRIPVPHPIVLHPEMLRQRNILKKFESEILVASALLTLIVTITFGILN